jgi:hypothetical protein
MEITREIVLSATIILGPIVLASYAYGISHAEDGAALWGGIPESWRSVNVACMFIAATGYLMFWWIALFQLEVSTLEALRWPWGESDGEGMSRLLLAYLLILIPSALWIESTIFHLSSDYSWTPILVVGILFLVAVGNVMLGMMAYGAYQDGVDGAGLMFAGAVMLGLQCIVNDFVIWSYKFPW